MTRSAPFFYLALFRFVDGDISSEFDTKFANLNREPQSAEISEWKLVAVQNCEILA